uniref:Uncharacterized protein n=1 Tax=Anguilla anguilla TaxID=7936 RepID=A0A0E9VYZ7_ANGAN
MRVNHLALH